MDRPLKRVRFEDHGIEGLDQLETRHRKARKLPLHLRGDPYNIDVPWFGPQKTVETRRRSMKRLRKLADVSKFDQLLIEAEQAKPVRTLTDILKERRKR